MGSIELRKLYRGASSGGRIEFLFMLAEHVPEVAIALAATEAGYMCESARTFLQVAGRTVGLRGLNRLGSDSATVTGIGNMFEIHLRTSRTPAAQDGECIHALE